MDNSSRKSDKNTAEEKGFCIRRRQKNTVNNMNRSESSLASEITAKQAASGKRALLVCVSYKKQKFELKGTVHDMKNMRDFLVRQFKFPSDSILILAEKESYPSPTRQNIEDGFQWLMRGIKAGDSLVFYFSGHGMRQRASSPSDEIDGFDETICPIDFQTNGSISDNYINKTIVGPLIQGVTLHAIVDSCHSGTVLDLPLAYNIITGEWDDSRPAGNPSNGTSGGRAICISACEDYQLAADTSAFSQDMNGAMTHTFIRAVKGAVTNKKKISYREILDHMHQSLNKVDNVGCVRGRFRRSFQRRILQDPMLSSTEKFDINKEFKL